MDYGWPTVTPGTAQIATNLDLNPEDVRSVVESAQNLRIDLVVVGPELPLAYGLVDQLNAIGIPAFGPTKAAAQIESSKGFARRVMQEAGVPGPDFCSFSRQQEALDFVRKHPGPLVVKADGLAAGKGVALCFGPEEAVLAVRACMTDRIFGEAGAVVVIEELLSGPEVSVFAFCDGWRLSAPVAACDYKRVGDGNTGPNTGGMGSYTPPTFWTDSLAEEVMSRIMRPTVEALAHRGTPYRGVLYAGVMLTESGPRVLEFNCRFGDPEAQVILPLLKTDPIDVMLACVNGQLDQVDTRWSSRPHVGIVMTSGGYPGPYQTGFEISGLDAESPNTQVFHAGTTLISEAGLSGAVTSRVATSGGRVLTVVGWGDSLEIARANAYRRVDTISYSGASWRTDIGIPWIPDQEGSWSPDPAAQTS